MKKIIIVAAVALHASVTVAGDAEVVLDSKIQVDDYTASVGGPVGCKMPADLNHPKDGECEVKKGKLEPGWKLVKVNGKCYRDETRLAEWMQFKSDGKEIDLPATTNRRINVDCPA